MIDCTLTTVVVGNNSLAREGLRRILDGEDFTVEASVDCCTSLPSELPDDATPNLVIVDGCAPDQLSAELENLNDNFPESRTVVLSDHFDLDEVIEAFECGADGYVIKEISCEALVESLRLVAMGEKVMPTQLASCLSGLADQVKTPQLAKNPEVTRILSDREITTLRYLLVGHANKVIARRLEISEATVKVYVKAILRKLRVSNRTQAAIWAFNNGVKMVSDDVEDCATQEEPKEERLVAAT